MNKLTAPIFPVAIVVGLILNAGGCGSPLVLFADTTIPTASQVSHARSSSNRYDAGVLFANEASYLCIPLEKLGINPAQEILSVKSSCECVRPSVVRFLQRRSQEGVALRLDFVEDTQGHADETSPSSLAVEIKLQFASGTEQSVSIQFLHTTQMGTAS